MARDKMVGIIDFVSSYAFRDRLKGRFSYEGCEALYEYLWEYSVEISEPIEFDPVAIRVEYTEYKSAAEALEDYDPDLVKEYREEYEDDADFEQACYEELEDNTKVIVFDGGVIIQNY